MRSLLKQLTDILEDMGAGILFLQKIFQTARHSPCSKRALFEQIWRVVCQSYPTTALAGFFTGAILSVQFSLLVTEFGALGFLGGLSTSATFREIGPLLIAFMLSGKIGAFTTAELGTMKVTEQIDAIRCLGANPIQEIILPRFMGIIISSFFLLFVGLVMSLGGGVLMGVLFAHITPEEYIRHIPTIVTLPSILSGLFKCLAFAFMLAAVCTYKGYTTTGGAKGVGKAVVHTAMATMVGIVLTDWVTSLLSETVFRMCLGE